jgi:hypothetical protein
MSEMSDWSDEETGETRYSSVACSAPCPESDGECALEAGHYARHACGTNPTDHRWVTEAPA